MAASTRSPDREIPQPGDPLSKRYATFSQSQIIPTFHAPAACANTAGLGAAAARRAVISRPRRADSPGSLFGVGFIRFLNSCRSSPIMQNDPSLAPRGRRLTLFVVGLAIVGLGAGGSQKSAAVQSPGLLGLCQSVLHSPQAQTVDMANDLMTFKLVLRLEGPAKREICVRQNKRGEIVDVAFVLVTPEEDKFYYQASIDGQLIKAAHVNDSLAPLSHHDALKPFQRELDYWLLWSKNNPGPKQPPGRAASNRP
jgi:hypothetical protein